MAEESLVAAAGRPRRRWTLGRFLSVWHFLVAIALLPTLTLPVLATQLARERLAAASTATDLEHELLAAESVDRLRVAVTAEGVVGSLALVAEQVGLPLAIINSQLGWDLGSVSDARAATDRALAAVPQIDEYTTAVRKQFAAELPAVRAGVDRALYAPRQGLGMLGQPNAGYQRLLTGSAEAEQALAHHVGLIAQGSSGRDLLTSTRSFDAITAVAATQASRVGLFYRGLLNGTADAEPLGSESERYRVLRAELARDLDPRWAGIWDELTADERFRTFDEAAAKGPLTVPGLVGSDGTIRVELSTLPSVLPTARAAVWVVRQMSALIQRAAQETAAIARAEGSGARRRAAVWVAGTALVIVLTTIALFAIGGTLRRRLNHLAEGATRLSAGHLQPVAVQGPRELAATGAALNAAVASLRHVEAKAVILASGDLNSPELEQPAPGPLGAAMQASVSRIVAAVREREELQLQLAYQASHDALTGLPNRAELDRSLAAALGRAVRAGTPVSVLFVDLDGFKACNDRFGHAAGDHVLRVAAQRLREAVRPGDVVGRLGGDEFVVLIEGAAPTGETVQIGERIVTVMAQPITYEGHRVTIGASAGLAGCDRGQATADELLSDADAAVYQAKASGRGRVVVHGRSEGALL